MKKKRLTIRIQKRHRACPYIVWWAFAAIVIAVTSCVVVAQVAVMTEKEREFLRSRMPASGIPSSISVPPSSNPEFLRNQLQKQLLGM